ncbi:NYN domain-containing protein (plasmid) [Streptomyces sp. Qhu-G9]|uniref:NYN domain-containing protein n=1 Tax=Streptomyces sp. Qhu-G9 TaxID=3452799 RepID=UPI0022ABD8BE|nr:NYN domain-containing protein [Streptomyces aurantiacus]WAU78379.1 NYN domain-containing protein [Streptomyces aurantiacus]
MSALIVYIDGYNLFHGLRAKYKDDRYQWLDITALAASLRRHEKLVSVKYYTAPLQGSSDAVQRQQTYLSALRAVSGETLTVYEARYQSKTVTCRCGRQWRTYEEKETDVHLAVDLVADVATKAATSAVIISGDSDLCPAVRRAREFSEEVRIVAAFPPKRISSELQQLLPGSLVIGRGRIKDAQLPDTVHDPATGAVFHRPSKWRPNGNRSQIPHRRGTADSNCAHPASR